MKKTSIKLILATLIASGTALLAPVSTHAVTQSATGDSSISVSQKAQFSLTVQNSLTLSSVSFKGTGNTSTINVTPQTIGTGTITASVASNVKYNISLSAENPALSNSGKTASIPASSTVTAGTNGWGVKKNGQYTGLTTNAVNFFSSTAAGTTTTVTSTPTTFDVGVAVSPVLPADTYSTVVTVTAIAQ